MIVVDGGYGEGGGAILRNAVALSAALGKPVRVANVRKGRREPGLKAQHFAGVKALSQICGGKVEGLSIGSTEVAFTPGEVRGGSFSFDVGTAGSVTLVLQSLLPALAFAPGETSLTIRGGTDVSWSPPADYLGNVLLPVLSRMGFPGELEVKRRGFYPKGGGVVEARFKPVEKRLKPLVFSERGELTRVCGNCFASSLPARVVERQLGALRGALKEKGLDGEISFGSPPADSPGSAAVLWANFSSGAVLGASALGERGKKAERVGEEAALGIAGAIQSGACVDAHLCDQLLAFCALAGGESVFTAQEWTPHAEANAWLLSQFIKKSVRIERTAGGIARVSLEGMGFER